MNTVSINERKKSVGGKLFNFRPMLFCALFFATGVFSVYLYVTGGNFLACILLSVSAIPISLLLSDRRRFFFRCVLFLLFFALGVFSSFSQIERFEKTTLEGRYEITGKIVEARSYENAQSFTIENLTIDGKRERGVMRVYVYGGEWAELSIGESVLFTGDVVPTEIDKDAFSYGYISDEVRFTANPVGEVAHLQKETDLFMRIRARLKERLYSGMTKESAAFTYAVLTGDTSGIESGLLENVRLGGVAYIFAVSGLHIGSLYAFCVIVAAKLNFRKRPIKFFVVAALILFYGGVCGFSASVVRAIVMCLLSYAFHLWGIKGNSIERIGCAMLVCLAHSPVSLLSAGFLLSFGACFGIAVLSRTFSDWLNDIFRKDGKGRNGFFDFLAVSLSAQLFTAPLCLYFFGYASVWGLLLNFLFVPLLSAIFSLLLLFGMAACLLPSGAACALLKIPSVFLSGVLLVFHGGDFSFTVMNGRTPTFAQSSLYYAFFTVLSDKINLKKSVKIIVCGAIVCLFTILLLACG